MHDVAIKQDGQIVESHANLEQYQQTNWHTQICSDGSAPNARVVYDPNYLMNTGAVPRLDTSITVNNSDLQQQYDAFLASDTGPMGSALWDTAMGKTGDRPDIGPATNWTAQYLLSRDARAETVIMAQADAAGSVPWHFRDQATGHVITITDYPGISINSTSIPAEYLAVDYTGTGWTPDTAHQYDMTYVPYVFTGDRYYLDQIQAEATFPLLYYSNVAREGAQGIVDAGQIRAVAWSLRALDNAAYLAPDADPLKSYFEDKVQNNLDSLVRVYVTNGCTTAPARSRVTFIPMEPVAEWVWITGMKRPLGGFRAWAAVSSVYRLNSGAFFGPSFPCGRTPSAAFGGFGRSSGVSIRLWPPRCPAS